jgi:DNA topoisomerase-2
MLVEDFFKTDFRDFSLDNTVRSLPSIIDGFKESQRKIIYGMSTRGDNANPLRVEQMASLVSERTDYHHGGASLENAIVKLAQDFGGSNNINLLEPLGQFGSRLSPENSATRYIFTKFSSHFRKLYKKEDEAILEHHYSDEQKIEPKYYLPILPTVLVNGSRGMGTGYACTILSYNPKDLKTCIINKLNGKRSKKILPWYKNFKGTIENVDGSIHITGCLEIQNTTTIHISELPIGVYLDNYKEHLNKLEDEGFIKEYEDNSTEEGFSFTIKVNRVTTKVPMDELIQKFKLKLKVKENLTLWNINNKIQVYKDANDIVKDFVDFRLKKYEVRRLKQIEILNEDISWLKEKMKFIKFYITNSLLFTKKGKADLFKLLEKEGFTQIDKLLNLRIYTLTKDEILKLKNQLKGVVDKVKELKKLTAKDIYLSELNELKL